MTSTKSFSAKNIAKWSLLVAWLVLFGMLLQRDYFIKTIETREAAALERAARTGYQGVYFKKSKIGYVESGFLPEADGLRITQKALLRLNIAGQTHPVELDLRALIDSSNLLQEFEFSFSSPFYRMNASGKTEGNSVSFTLNTGSSTIRDTIKLDAPPLIATSRRSYLLKQDIRKGEKFRIPWFDPLSLTAKNSVIEYRGKERILVHDRVFNLHRFIEVYSGTRVSSWLDDEGNVVKEESPAGFVFIREPEYRAKELSETSSELLSAVAVKIKGEMVDLSGREEMNYRLKLPEDTTFELDSSRQEFKNNILTLRLEKLPQPDPSAPPCEDAELLLKSTPYIQSDAEAIVRKSREITDGLKGELSKVEALAKWVFENLEKRPVIGIPDALTTLDSLRGDCNEHASLFTALARAAGIPTKMAAGVVFHKGAFYYHAWNEVCISGRWISLDTTTMQFPADLSHLKFVEGELQEQVRIGALLNTLEIEPIP